MTDSRKALAISFIPVLLVSILFGAYLSPSNGATHTTNGFSTNYPSFVNTTQTTDSVLGLKLVASVNTTSIQSGHAIKVTVSAINSLSTENVVKKENEWATSALSVNPCQLPVDFVVFRGYYDSSSVYAANSPVQVFPNEQPICPIILNTFSFQPNGSTSFGASVRIINGNYSTQPVPVANLVPLGSLPKTFFSAGVYTIAAGDEWGQIALLHFVVTSASTTNGTTSS